MEANKLYEPDRKLLVKLGKHIKSLRKERNYTLEVLAEKSKLNPQAISRIENGHKNFSISTLYDLAKGLEVEPDNLLV